MIGQIHLRHIVQPLGSEQSLRCAREELALDLGVNKEELIFTSGATEANNSIFAHVASNGKKGGRCILSPFEHPSIIEPARHWFQDRLAYMPADASGRVDLDETEQLLNTENISLVSLMAANNETGVIQPWQELSGTMSGERNFFSLRCDSVDWQVRFVSLFNFVPLSRPVHISFQVQKDLVGLLSKEPIQLQLGGQQEKGSRGGTENYPAIASMLVALKDAIKSWMDYSKRCRMERSI